MARMVVNSELLSIALAATGVGLIATSSLPALFGIPSSIWRQQKRDDKTLYEDKDGVATEETEFAFSDKLPKLFLYVTSIIGFLTSLASAVFATLNTKKSLFLESWATVLCWAFLILQAAIISLERSSVKRFNLGIYGAISCTFLIIIICSENWLLTQRTYQGKSAHFAFTFAQIAIATSTLCAHISLPRRPDVLKDGRMVDRQFTVSAFARYSFQWCEPLLEYATLKGRLEMEDLSVLDHLRRSFELQERYWAMKKQGRAWKLVFWSHAGPFARQWVLTLLESIASFAPQVCMFQILRLLEKRGMGQDVAVEAWWWVSGLGLSKVIQAWLESWLWWVCWCQLCVPIRSQLSALIFQKTMRKKDVKGVQKADPKGKTKANGTVPEVNQGSTPQVENAEEDNEGGTQKSKQGTINLVGIDVKRIADFVSYNNIFPSTLFNLIIAVTFLLELIGWRSLLAGFTVTIVSTPINAFFAKKYAKAQEDLMKERDSKMAVVTEALQGIRQIKFSALETQWQAKIRKIRERELGQQWNVFKYDSWLIFCWIVGPVMLAAVTLAVYAVIHGELSPSVAFTTLAIFNRLEVTLGVIPELTTMLLDAWVSMNRIEKYLDSPEKEQNTSPGEAISFQNASVAWPSEEVEEHERYILRDVNLSFPNEELSVISGKTGSGKSLLIASILGESDLLSGVIKVPKAPSLYDRYDHKATKANWIIPSAIAYVAQIPWIENATIKDNILFGLPYDADRYWAVVSACALQKDLDMMTDGELTEIGANGINLSGGQRWRVSFARALYSRAGILVLDDIFSAVDAHVGRHIFEEGLTGDLAQGRTRILVTHHVALCLPKTKYTVSLGDGTVEHAGTIDELKKTGELEEILSHEQAAAEEDENISLPSDSGVGSSRDSTVKDTIDQAHATEAGKHSAKVGDEGDRPQKIPAPKKFIEDEKRETGSVKWAIYREYLDAAGGTWFWVIVLVMFVGYQAMLLGRSWWIKIWTSSYHTEAEMVHYTAFHYSFAKQWRPSSMRKEDRDLWYYLNVYLGLSIAVSLVGVARYWWIYVGSIRTSRVLFDNLTFTILRAPLRWLDTVPLGRVLNRFTSDFNIIDSRLGTDVAFLLYNVLQVSGIIIAGLFVSPWMILIAITLMALCLHYAKRYLAGAREVKRLESNAKSPVFELFGSSLTGVGTIRAFDKGDIYVTRMFSKIDEHARTLWHLWLFNRWMGFRMAMLGALFAFMIAAVIVSVRGIDAALAGFAIGFALDFTQTVIWMIRRYANTELNMNSCERVIEYSNLKIEDQSGLSPPAAWPQEGRLAVEDLVVGYAPDLPPVLKGLSFSVERNQRVGIVGRTGAGKSSLTLALFRFLEAREGGIYIDGLDISKIKLHDLRSRLAIIPQDPVLFSGTIRSNLDAFNEHTDAELRDALERVHLVHTISRDEYVGDSQDTNVNIFEDLNSRISEGGLNLSQGQRQLLCLARAIVSRPKIMVLDEATSAVDMATDVLIQRSIREEFGDSTLLVIAHRLSTIADFDRILVMSDGRAVEYGDPKTLMAKKGEFWDMVSQSGERAKLEESILGGRRS